MYSSLMVFENGHTETQSYHRIIQNISMSFESYPKEFEKTTEVLPFTKYGLSSIQEFKEAEKELQQLEGLKKAGLTQEEINLYKENKAGLLDQRRNIESNAMRGKLNAINDKVNKLTSEKESSEEDIQASTSNDTLELACDKMLRKSITFYPDGHPMNNIKEIEQNLFDHLNKDDMMPITKRRKILRHLERKKDRILALENKISIGTVTNVCKVDRPGSLWDVKEMLQRQPQESSDRKPVIIGPKKRTMYTLKDSKIVRLEPINNERKEYKAVDIVLPVNDAEVHLLEGTKMSIDEIKKIERFKDYKPGIPSKTLYLKNIAPSVTQDQLSILFNQFTLANGGPVNVRLMTGRMRGQAFISFQTEDIAIQALEETNGTILSGRPVITVFGCSNNKTEENR